MDNLGVIAMNGTNIRRERNQYNTIPVGPNERKGEARLL